MKSKFLFGLLFMGILTISNISYAQEMGLQEILTGKKDTREEEKNLKFQSYFFEALKQKAINNYSKAIENLEACYAIDSKSKAVEFEFSKNFLLLKKYFEAEIFIDKALKQDPKNLYLLAHKVSIYKAQRDFENAITVQKEIVVINPKYSDSLVLLYLQNKNYEQAEDLIQQVEAKALATTKIKGYKRYIENRKKALKKPKAIANKTTKTNDISLLKKQYGTNKDFKTLRQILNAELKSEEFKLLYSDSKGGLELFPSQPYLYFMNGLALNKLAKYNEAIAVLTIGIDFVIEDNEMEANFYEQLFIANKGLKNKSEALKFQEKAKKLRGQK